MGALGCEMKEKSSLLSRSSHVLYSGNEVLAGSINPKFNEIHIQIYPVDCPFRCLEKKHAAVGARSMR